jgi:aryl-alcohol dehydrogenase-like predicted oxidoreductase
MKSVVLENTDIRVSRLSLGTGGLHHILRAPNRQRLLAAAVDCGITHFDTSPYYGDGLAEVELGRFMDRRRAALTIATKVGLYPHGKAAYSGWEAWVKKAAGKLLPHFAAPIQDWSIERARTSLRQSLSRLRTDYVDFLFLHEPDLSLIDGDAFLRWLEGERKTGTIRSWGLAGLPLLIGPWLQQNSALASVIQTRDDLSDKSADFLLHHNRNLQFTYGYFSAVRRESNPLSVADVMQGALRRNSGGSILVSTRRPERLASLASFVQ